MKKISITFVFLFILGTVFAGKCHFSHNGINYVTSDEQGSLGCARAAAAVINMK